MRGYRDFIVKVDKLKENTLTTKGGVTIHLDGRLNQKEVTNSVVEVVSVPCTYDGPIKAGFNLFVDPTIFFTQVYEKGGEMESIHLVDREKGWYKVNPSMIICYSEGEGTMWKGFNDNLLVEKCVKNEVEELKKIGSIIIPSIAKNKIETQSYKILIINDLIEEVDVEDEVFVNEQMIVDVYLRGYKLSWIRNMDILAVINNKEVA